MADRDAFINALMDQQRTLQHGDASVNPLVDALMSQYRRPDSGPDEIYTTADVRNRLGSDSAVTRPMRSFAELLRGFARGPEDVPTNGKLVPFLANAGAGGLDTAANWLDRRPKIGPDTLAPLGLAAIGSAPMGALVSGSIRRKPLPTREDALQSGREALYAEGPSSSKVNWHEFTSPNGVNNPARAASARADELMEQWRVATDPVEKSRLTALISQAREAEMLARGARSWEPHQAFNDAVPGRYLNADNARASLPGEAANALGNSQADPTLEEWLRYWSSR